MTAFPAGEEQREFQYKSDCEIYTGTLHGWSRAALKSSKICPILAHQVFGTVEELFRGCGSNSERLGCAVTLDHTMIWRITGAIHAPGLSRPGSGPNRRFLRFLLPNIRLKNLDELAVSAPVRYCTSVRSNVEKRRGTGHQELVNGKN